MQHIPEVPAVAVLALMLRNDQWLLSMCVVVRSFCLMCIYSVIYCYREVTEFVSKWYRVAVCIVLKLSLFINTDKWWTKTCHCRWL